MLDQMPLERPRPPLPIPRGLVFVASGWITVSWIFAMGLEPPLQPSSSVYAPAARMLLCSLVIGGLVGWPLVRLCSAIPRRPIASALLDVVTLIALLQVLLWPLRLVTSWPISRTLLIDVHGIIWLLITGGVIAIATAKEGAIRISRTPLNFHRSSRKSRLCPISGCSPPADLEPRRPGPGNSRSSNWPSRWFSGGLRFPREPR
jgi:hypothetical protein